MERRYPMSLINYGITKAKAIPEASNKEKVTSATLLHVVFTHKPHNPNIMLISRCRRSTSIKTHIYNYFL